MRIAVIGSGVAGNGAAWLLSREHDVELGGATFPVDVGFMVFNERTYPELCGLFEHLGIEWRETDMSFSVHIDDTGLEWAGDGRLGGVFAQPGNALKPAFWGMLNDIRKMARQADDLVADPTTHELTLGQMLEREHYGTAFRDWFLVPMTSAIWSTPPDGMLEFPASSFVRFAYNHGLLSFGGGVRWRTVIGGSRQYVGRLAAGISGEVRRGSPVTSVTRPGQGARVECADGWSDHYDAVVIAAHAPEALAMLGDASSSEQEILSAFPYLPNPAVLHTDERFLPRRHGARASWNHRVETAGPGASSFSVTYDLTRLQGHASSERILLTLNPPFEPDPARVLRQFEFDHPQFTREGLAAQERIGEIQGVSSTYFTGAWQRWGFHEDGMWSAVRVARMLGVETPWSGPGTLHASESEPLGAGPRAGVVS